MLNTSGLVVPHGTAAPSCQRMRGSCHRRKVSRLYFCSFRLKMSPDRVHQAAIRKRSGSDQAAIRKRSAREPPCKQGESGIGYADLCSPTHRPPSAGGPSSHRRGERGRQATAGGRVPSMPLHAPPSGGTLQPHGRPPSLSLRRPATLVPYPLRRLLTPPAPTPPLRGGRAVARSARLLSPPCIPPKGGEAY